VNTLNTYDGVHTLGTGNVTGSIANCVPSYWPNLPYKPKTSIQKLEHGFVVEHLGKQYAFETLEALNSFIVELFEIPK
jgi:hypothetical protein